MLHSVHVPLLESISISLTFFSWFVSSKLFTIIIDSPFVLTLMPDIRSLNTGLSKTAKSNINTNFGEWGWEGVQIFEAIHTDWMQTLIAENES